jgi:hypothetical protein
MKSRIKRATSSSAVHPSIGRANSGVRRAQAAVLYRSGMSMERIGTLLGISRQRVAILLRGVLE